jgi:hypothetical protein
MVTLHIKGYVMGLSLEKYSRIKLFIVLASLVIILAGIKAASTVIVPFFIVHLYCNNV